MPNPDPGRVRSLFDQAAAVPPARREQFVRAAAGDDAALAAEVLALLAGLTQPPEIVVRPTHTAATVGAPAARPERTAAPVPPSPAPGDIFRRGGPMGKDFNLLDAVKLAADEPVRHPERVGSYRIIRLIGEGGYGVVYLAEQASPKREVALKLLRPGLGRGTFRRFADEARMLARLQHPGIAQVYEAGVAQVDGPYRAFFAMEYIRGERLDAHIESHMLDTRARLRLLASICHAVHHAHQKGIIHRDLKPANILIDEHGQPKVIDFGVARLTDRDINATTRQSNTGDRIGTLYYMSPEQIAGDPDDLDTRSDVYALGVIGHELLAGELPYEVRGKAEYEIASAIREATPTRLSSVSRAFRGDIETIIGKALAKEKDRRYTSASALAADIERFLNDEPIEARPASAWYQARKFAARNKAVTSATVVSMIVVFVATLAIAKSRVETSRARERAALHAVEARDSRIRELDAQTVALAQQIRANFTPAALGEIDALLASHPSDDVRLRLLRAEILDAMNQFSEARAEIDSLRQRPDLGKRYADVLLWHGDINITSAIGPVNVREAEQSIREALDSGLSSPADDAYARALLANDVPECVRLLEEAVERDPRHIRAQNLLSFLDASLMGRPELGLVRARSTRVLAPLHPGPLIVEAIALTLLGRVPERNAALSALERLVGQPQFRDAERYFALFDEVIDVNNQGRAEAAINRVALRVLPIVMRGFGGASANTTDIGVELRFPAFMATEFSVRQLVADLLHLLQSPDDSNRVEALASKFRRLGPGIAPLVDAFLARRAYDRGDVDSADRLAASVLSSSPLLRVKPEVAALWVRSRYDRWREAPSEESRQRLLDAVGTLNLHWKPCGPGLFIGGILAELGLFDLARIKLADLANAFADDPVALHAVLFQRIRVEHYAMNSYKAVELACQFLDAAKSDDEWRRDVMFILECNLRSTRRLPPRDGQPQTEDDIRARYGLPRTTDP